MVVILDTGFIVALRNKDDDFHSQAVEMMKTVLKGVYGSIIVNDYVFNESMTLTMVRTGKLSLVKDIGKYIIKSERISLVNIDQDLFSLTWELFLKYFDHKLSFTDCSILALSTLYESPCFVATYEKPLMNLVIALPGINKN